MKEPTVEEVGRMSPEERSIAFQVWIARQKRSERRWNIAAGVIAVGVLAAIAGQWLQ